jgi:hypothetical protein
MANHANPVFERPVLRLTDTFQDIDISDGRLESFGVNRLGHSLVLVSAYPWYVV